MAPLLARLEAPLTPALARKAGAALALAAAAAVVLWLATAPRGVRADGAPLGADFVTFHAAGRLALHGALAFAYDTGAITAAEQLSAPGERLTYLWRYPPPFAFVAAALGVAPYLVAYGLWTVAGVAALGTGLTRLLPARDAWLLALGAPATLVCGLHGQTGLMTAALFAWGFALLDRRPWLAGAILGLLVCKPHFAALVPVALLAGGRWRALGGFAAGAGALCLAALLVFGPAPWHAFFRTAPDMVRVLQTGGLSWVKVPSAFTLGLSLGLPVAAAWTLQALSAGLGVAATALVWRAPGDRRGKAAVTAAGALLLSPYLFDYDLVLASTAAALAMAGGLATAPGGRLAILLLLATAGAAPLLAEATGLQLGCLPLIGGVLPLASAYVRARSGLAASPSVRSDAVFAAPGVGS